MAKSPYTNLPEPFKTQLPAMFGTYPNLDSSTPSSWFVWTGDVVQARPQRACHANLCYDGPGWDNLVTAVPKSDELSLEYLRMLIRGPFRSLSDLIKLERVGDNYYLHCLELGKWPGNVLMNFCIASRIPIEFHWMLPAWHKRCEAGFDPVLAFLLTYSYGQSSSDSHEEQHDHRSFNIFRSGHMWLDPASNWSNILSGTFDNVSKPFKTHNQDSRPTNCIWGICKDYTFLKDMTDYEIAEFYTQPLVVLEEPQAPTPPQFKIKKHVYGDQNFAQAVQAFEAANNAGMLGVLPVAHNVEVAVHDNLLVHHVDAFNHDPQPAEIEHFANEIEADDDEPHGYWDD